MNDPLPSDETAQSGPLLDPPPSPADAVTQERDELLDRLLRTTADFDNYRKRVERERHEITERAGADVVMDVLAVLDDVERALAVDCPPQAAPYRQGVELIHRQLLDVLKRRGVTAVEAVGRDFDPHVHQAVTHDESPGARDGEVIGELRRGYRLGERLLRPALVRVAKAS
jgi:molecular chaperone GrpE